MRKDDISAMASALGKLNRGVPKNYTAEERAKRSERMKKARCSCPWATKRANEAKQDNAIYRVSLKNGSRIVWNGSACSIQDAKIKACRSKGHEKYGDRYSKSELIVEKQDKQEGRK